MTDSEKREKVIQALENCICYPKRCQNCPWDVKGDKCDEDYIESLEYPQGLVENALALLREQDEGVEPVISRKSVTETTVSFWYKCGACGGEIEQGDDEFCRHCGRKVLWDE